jgi:hypothetical protein
MKSDDEMIDISDDVGEVLCGGGDVDGVNMSGDSVARTVRDRKGSVSDGADMEEGACEAGGTREEGQSLDWAYTRESNEDRIYIQ